MRKDRKKRKKKLGRIMLAALTAVLLFSIASYTAYVYKTSKNWEGFIYPSIKIMDVEVGGKTKDEAVNLLKERYGDVVVKKLININYKGKVYSIDYSKLNARYNIDEVVNGALSYGKDLSIFKKASLIKAGAQKEYKLLFESDSKYIDEVIAAMEKDINKAPVDAAVEMISRGNFKVTPDVKGYKLLSEKLKKDITKSINGELQGDVSMDAPVETLTAVKSAEKLAKINGLVSTFSTNFSTSALGRSINIELSTKAINGKLVMPGDTFSFNETVGQRTKSRGYQEAGVIIGNKIESGLGGGICQVSSTLYNAVLKTGAISAERIHHTLPSSYVGLGLDATVDWGNIDYKFKNTLEYPIYIEGYVLNKHLYFNLYSNSSLTQKNYVITNEVYENIKFTTKTIKDATLPEGQKVIDQKGSTGHRVKVYKSTYENGKLISKDMLYNDYYKPVQAIIKVGTKKVSKPTEPVQEKEQTTEPTKPTEPTEPTGTNEQPAI